MTELDDHITFAISAGLSEIERMAHQNGWDQPMAIYTLFRQLEDDGGIYVGFMPWPADVAMDGNPVDVVEWMVATLTPQTATTLERVCHPDGTDIIGIAQCSEGWMVAEDDQVPGVAYADNPKGREVRVIAAVDTTRTVHTVTRPRGEEAAVWTHPLDADPSRGATALANLLNKIIDAAPNPFRKPESTS